MRQFKQRGGAWGLTRRGFVMNVTWPFVTLTVEEDALLLRVAGRSRRYPKSALQEIRTRDGLISQGLHFSTRNPGGEFRFWSFDRDALIAALEERGYAVSHESPLR